MKHYQNSNNFVVLCFLQIVTEIIKRKPKMFPAKWSEILDNQIQFLWFCLFLSLYSFTAVLHKHCYFSYSFINLSVNVDRALCAANILKTPHIDVL